MNIGFTGTQEGMTFQQKFSLGRKLDELNPTINRTVAHHGDCVGADAEFHVLCQARGISVCLRPCTITSKRAYCVDAIRTALVQDPITRNHFIVADSELMFATPKDDHEVLRSGTWATIRYAQKLWKHIIVIWPDGTITEFNQPQ